VFYADLHVHSKFSRATSGESDLEHLALWAAKKGISVLGTGDFTHPKWFEEIQEKLVAAEPGLFRLRPDLEKEVRRGLAPAAVGDVRFALQVEISTIYKKDGRTRKVHHLVYVPDLESARRVIQSLARIGNLASDGRPILGLDSRNLLEITLQAGEGCYLVPAHIWTPWFAVLGSQSGFDAIEHCYGDLSPEIFALETGLSSDPAMNWRLSGLDRYTLVSNSDAHSPQKLGREACVFDTELDYFAIRRALQTGEGYRGTVEFFPEEGKYHYDGHRKCGVCLAPEESRHNGGKCPECGKPLTLGVMYRVAELADRPAPPDPLPPKAAPFQSLIPLDEVLSEVHGVGPQTATVRRNREELLDRLGTELFVLPPAPPEDIARAGSTMLAEAIRRMRSGQVIRQAGYDGEYGTIRLFTEEERMRRTSVGLLFDIPEGESARCSAADGTPAQGGAEPPCRRLPNGLNGSSADDGHAKQLDLLPLTADSRGILERLDPDQRAAAEITDGPLLIVAGPGTGKTRTLTHRLAYLVAAGGARPEQCLALTFSRRAANEMIERLGHLMPSDAHRVHVSTFHAFGFNVLREHGHHLGLGEPLRVATQMERAEMLRESLPITPTAAGQALARISRSKRQAQDGKLPEDGEERRVAAIYENGLRARGWLDFDDLVVLPLRLLRDSPELVALYRSRYPWVAVDEYQDIDAVQYEIVRLLVSANGNLCAIGDPDQAIYGFRGADVRFFQRFCEDFPAARTVLLTRNYRSTQTIVDAALQLISPSTLVEGRSLDAHGVGPEQIEIHACASDRAEAEHVVHAIEQKMGGSTFFSFDSDRVAGHETSGYSFSDFAVLYRTEAQADAIVEALDRSGMPFQRHSHSLLADEPSVQTVIAAMHERQVQNAPGASVLELLEKAAVETPLAQPQHEPTLAALRVLAARHGSDLAQFLSELALGVDADLWDARADRVSLLTLHAAKGLEFPVVFIVGCEDGLLPLRWGMIDEQSLAEERRLLFVGMTRAREHLILTHAKKRRLAGRVRESIPSPLLDDIERQLLAHHQHRATKKRPPPDRQRTLFEP
jgi:DNA helicase II / ATP-dependent DNA helicase PcrA